MRRKQAEQVRLAIEDGGPDRARLKKYNAYFTPQGATRRVVQALREDFGIRPRRLRDPNAGGGVFGWAVRHELPDAHRTGIEVREGSSLAPVRACVRTLTHARTHVLSSTRVHGPRSGKHRGGSRPRQPGRPPH